MPAMDSKTTVDELREMAIRFRDERNWEQFHTAKDLVLGLGIEVAELQELLLWKSTDEVAELARSESGRARIREEIADVFIYLMYLSRHFDVDLSDAVRSKIAQNGEKYPVDRSYGSHKKYTDL